MELRFYGKRAQWKNRSVFVFLLFMLCVAMIFIKSQYKTKVRHNEPSIQTEKKTSDLVKLDQETTGMLNDKLMDKNSFILKMKDRASKVKEVCSRFHKTFNGSSSTWNYHNGSPYEAKSIQFRQTIHPRNLLLEPKSKTAYCFIHKVASSTWMAIFKKIHKDNKQVQAILNSGVGNCYKIAALLGARRTQEVEKKILTGTYYSFMVVRHPFDRVLSAYRNRIMDKKAGQAKKHNPKIFKAFQDPKVKFDKSMVFNHKTGELKYIPTFVEFLEYIMLKLPDNSNDDRHWNSYNQDCAPCVIPYRAIIKLEGTGEEEALISFTNLNIFVSSNELSKEIYHTAGGPTPNHRYEFFKDVPCSLLVRLTKHFEMDLEMFQYKTDDFMNMCK